MSSTAHNIQVEDINNCRLSSAVETPPKIGIRVLFVQIVPYRYAGGRSGLIWGNQDTGRGGWMSQRLSPL